MSAIEVSIQTAMRVAGRYVLGPAETVMPGAITLAISEMWDGDERSASVHLVEIGDVLVRDENGWVGATFTFAICGSCRRLPAAPIDDGLVACPPCRHDHNPSARENR